MNMEFKRKMPTPQAIKEMTLDCTGISLPFFSYGGTALLMQMAEMGIVLSISRDLPAGRVGG